MHVHVRMRVCMFFYHNDPLVHSYVVDVAYHDILDDLENIPLVVVEDQYMVYALAEFLLGLHGSSCDDGHGGFQALHGCWNCSCDNGYGYLEASVLFLNHEFADSLQLIGVDQFGYGVPSSLVQCLHHCYQLLLCDLHTKKHHSNQNCTGYCHETFDMYLGITDLRLGPFRQH